jgi:hypothetical protein
MLYFKGVSLMSKTIILDPTLAATRRIYAKTYLPQAT